MLADPLTTQFRPNLTHLINDDPTASVSDTTPPSQPVNSQSERSSLSPAPPLTLKLGRPSQHRIAARANYSDSSDEEDDDDNAAVASTSVTQPPAKRPAKKSKKTHPTPSAPAAGGSTEVGGTKKYDWLAPSAVGASHHGPPDRSGAVSPTVSQSGGAGTSVSSKDGASDANRRMSGWAPGEDYVAQVAVETTVKKPTKTKGSGLGKAWRKGIKK
jgi:hypothetical protein